MFELFPGVRKKNRLCEKAISYRRDVSGIPREKIEIPFSEPPNLARHMYLFSTSISSLADGLVKAGPHPVSEALTKSVRALGSSMGPSCSTCDQAQVSRRDQKVTN